MTNQYTPEDVPTVLRRMFSDGLKLAESWDADGNKDLRNFEHGKFITEPLDEWAYNFTDLAYEYESTSTSLEQAHIDSDEHARRCDVENCNECNPV